MATQEILKLIEAIEAGDKDAIRRMLKTPDTAKNYCLVSGEKERSKFNKDVTLDTMTDGLNAGQNSDHLLSGVSERMGKSALHDLVALFPDEPEVLCPILDRSDILESCIVEPRMQHPKKAHTSEEIETAKSIADIFSKSPPHYKHSLYDLLTYQPPVPKDIWLGQNTALEKLVFWGDSETFEHVLKALPPDKRAGCITPELFEKLADSASDEFIFSLIKVLPPQDWQKLVLTLHPAHKTIPFLSLAADNNNVEDESRILAVTKLLFAAGAEPPLKQAAAIEITDSRGWKENGLDFMMRELISHGDFLTAAHWMEAGAYDYLFKADKALYDIHGVNNKEPDWDAYFKNGTKPDFIGLHMQTYREPAYAHEHIRKKGKYPKPLPPITDKKEYIAALRVMGMARALTNDVTYDASVGSQLHLVLANTPGSWSEIAEKIKDFSVEDACVARRTIHAKVQKSMPDLGDVPAQKAISYIIGDRSLVDMLKLGHGWSTGTESKLKLVSAERQQGLSRMFQEANKDARREK